MPDRISRHSASAALSMLPGGVLTVAFHGLLTGGALLQFRTEIFALHGPHIRAFVADYSGAVLALAGADLDAATEGARHGSAPYMPAALVVTPDMVDILTDHSARMALHGIRRRVFLARAAALHWAQQLAGLPADQ